MFENMGHTSGVHRHSSQCYQKYIFLIVCRQVDMLGTGYSVAVFLVAKFKGGYLLLA